MVLVDVVFGRGLVVLDGAVLIGGAVLTGADPWVEASTTLCSTFDLRPRESVTVSVTYFVPVYRKVKLNDGPEPRGQF
jgi:hypothetical protein